VGVAGSKVGLVGVVEVSGSGREEVWLVGIVESGKNKALWSGTGKSWDMA